MVTQKTIDGAMEVLEKGAIRNRVTAGQYTIGRLIEELESLEVSYDCWIELDFGPGPIGFTSWRGSYSELAIDWEADTYGVKFRHFLTDLKATIGKEYTGYKGGDFIMGYNTPLWVSQWGNADHAAVVGVLTNDSESNNIYRVVIETRYMEY